MNVTLRCLEAGMYEVRRGPCGFEPKVTLLAAYVGWDVLHGSALVGTHRSWGEARVWLNGPDGQRFLDQCEKNAATMGGVA